MAFVVGINLAISLRLAGFVPGIALAPLQRFYPLHWFGVLLILLSGIGLLLAYPAKALTNPVFYLKLVALLCALGISRYFQQQLRLTTSAGDTLPTLAPLAWLTLVLWVVTITAGRFLAYTHSILLASRYY